MLNYIRADMHRITRRVPRIVIVVLILVIAAVNMLSNAVSDQLNSIGFMAQIPFLFTIVGAIFGMVEIMSVFSDDFRAKTMQVAIGLGVSRRHVVLAKTIEYALLNLVDMLVLSGMLMGGTAAVGIGLSGDDVYQILVRAFFAMINSVIPAMFTMIPIFYLQGTGLAAVLFLVFYIDPLAQVISFGFSMNEIVIRLHLNELPYTAMANNALNAITLHTSFPLKQLLGLVIYIVAAYVLTALVFNKRELEF